MRYCARPNSIKEVNILLDTVEEIEVKRVQSEISHLKNEITHKKDIYYDAKNRIVEFVTIERVPAELIERVYQRSINKILKDERNGGIK